MPMTNFPQGFAQGLSLRGMPLLQTQPGNVFWVDNSSTTSISPNISVAGSDGNQGTFQRPFASIYGALAHCQQGNGDIIFVKPGHVEQVNGAGTTTLGTAAKGTALFFDVAGVSIIGLGSGPLRPQLNFITAATANIPVRAANMSIHNVLFTASFADIASIFTAVAASVTASIATTVLTVTVVGSGTLYPGQVIAGTNIIPGTIIISQLSGTTGGVGTYQVSNSQTFASGTVTAGAIDFNIEACEFRDVSSILNFLTVFTGAVTTVNTTDGFRFASNRISSLGTTAATTAIKNTVAQDRWQITDNFGNWAVLNDTAALLACGTAQMKNISIARNVCQRPNTSSTGGSFVSGSGNAWVGHCYDNYFYQVDNSAGIWIATGHGTALGFTNNFSPITGAADASALINPAAA